LDDTPAPGQLYESNRFALAALIEEAGGEPWMLPLVPDDTEQIREQLALGQQADILISSGGVSVGEFDLVRPALEAEGFSLDFWKVAIKPGKPLVFGRRGNCLFFGLPGNPGSSMVTFSLFVLPVLRKMMGLKRLFHTRCKARLTAPARATKGRIHFVRGRVTSSADQSELQFAPYHRQGSGNLLSMRNVDSLAILPADSGTHNEGDIVDVILLRVPWSERERW
jgi:molybdopterin molybdotransferase